MIGPILFRLEAGSEEMGPIGGYTFGGDRSAANTRGEMVGRSAGSLGAVCYSLVDTSSVEPCWVRGAHSESPACASRVSQGA